MRLPAQNVPFLTKDGNVDPNWYAALKQIEAFVNLFSSCNFPQPTPGGSPTAITTIANGQVLIWNATAGQFLPGAN